MSKKHDQIKIGDSIICFSDDSEDLDFGMSGIVLYGNTQIKIGRKYKIEKIFYKHIPLNNKKTWTTKEYPGVQWYWTLVKLEGVKNTQWLHNFKKCI